MGRELKPLKVETVIDGKTRQSVDIFFNRNEKNFFATVNMKEVEAQSAYECRKLVEKEFTAYKSPEWKRHIWLKLDALGDGGYGYQGQINNRHGCELEFQFERIELGKRPNGDYIRRPFAEDLDEREAERQLGNELAYAGNIWDEDLKKLIPYSDAAWAVLIELEAATKRAHAKLAEMFSTKDGGKRLVAMAGLPLLGDGGKKP